MLATDKKIFELEKDYDKSYKIEKVYDGKKLSVIKILDKKDKIYKALFYDEFERLSNLSIYDTESGKEKENITYKADGKTMSSVREYNIETDNLLKVTFYKPNGEEVSSIVEYDESGKESQCLIFCDNGEVEKFVI